MKIKVQYDVNKIWPSKILTVGKYSQHMGSFRP